MSALPPKADMCGATRHVRFVPIADIGIAIRSPRRPRRAAPGGTVEAERFRCFEVEGRFVLGGRLHRKVGGLGAAQDAVDIGGRLPKHVDLVGPVGHETAGRHEETKRVDRRQASVEPQAR